MLSCFICVWLFVIPRTIACHAHLSMGFSQQKYWSGLPCLPPLYFPTQDSKPCLLNFLHHKWILYCWAITLVSTFFSQWLIYIHWAVLVSIVVSIPSCLAGDWSQIPSGGGGQHTLGASLGAQLVKNPPAMRNTWPGEFHGLYSPWGRKESDTSEWLSLHFIYILF